jgi:hypothetical protein
MVGFDFDFDFDFDFFKVCFKIVLRDRFRIIIAKSIIESHNGKIWAENNSEGRGTIFSFSLPIRGK